MASLPEIGRYQLACRFLREGRRELALLIAGELLHSVAGREFAIRLLAELYPDAGNVWTLRGRSAVEGWGGEPAPAEDEQGG
jgi:hypothetical protein